MISSGNASTTNNLTHSFVAKGVRKCASQKLDPTEDVEVVLMSSEELFRLLEDGEIIQSLMAAPLWKFFYMSESNMRQ